MVLGVSKTTFEFIIEQHDILKLEVDRVKRATTGILYEEPLIQNIEISLNTLELFRSSYMNNFPMMLV